MRGEIHFVKNNCLKLEKGVVLENVGKEKMCLGKSYAAHVSFVN
jgi:hypothetical protein